MDHLDTQPLPSLNFDEDEDEIDAPLDSPPAIIDDHSEASAPEKTQEPPKPKLKKLSAVDQAALAQKEKKVEEAHVKPSEPAVLPTSNLPLPDASTLFFSIPAKTPDPEERIDNEVLFQITQEEQENSRKHIDFFWIDAHENRGIITLFGKVKINNSFASCSFTIHNNARSVCVLPKEDAGTIEVHKEMKHVLQPNIMTHVKGATWAGKVVKRNHTFQDASIPNESDYLKVVHDAKHPSVAKEVCEKGGEALLKTLGWSSSALETLVIKRKLMGP